MFFVHILAVNCYLYNFKSELLKPGEILFRTFDTYPGSLSINLALTNCEPPCQIELSAFEEVRRKQIFSNKTNYKAICCQDDLPCSSNSIYFADPAPVIRRPIILKQDEGDIVLGQSSTLSNSEIILKQNNDVDLSRKGLWTVLISNCGTNPVTIEGTAVIKRHDGYLDSRLQHFSIIGSIQTFFGIVLLGYFLFNWLKSLPKLTSDHNKIIFTSIFYILEGTLTVLLLIKWNKNGYPHQILVLLHTIIKSLSHSSIFYLSLLQLQRPHDIPIYIFLLIFLPNLYGTFIEDKSIIQFSHRQNGKWLFGFSEKPSIEFLVTIITHLCISYYSATHKPSESAQNDRRKTFLGIYSGSFVSFFFMNLSLLIWRLSKNLIETRKSEWVPFSIPSILFYILLSINFWYVSDINPEGWQTLETLSQDIPLIKNNKRKNYYDNDLKLNINENNNIPNLPNSSDSEEADPKNY